MSLRVKKLKLQTGQEKTRVEEVEEDEDVILAIIPSRPLRDKALPLLGRRLRTPLNQ